MQCLQQLYKKGIDKIEKEKNLEEAYKVWNMPIRRASLWKDSIDRIEMLYKVNTTAGWAKQQLQILADIAEQHHLPQWYVDEVRRICKGIKTASEMERWNTK